MIELTHLNKIYSHKGQETQALNNVSLCVNAGEIVGVIGKSGAGKSTLIRCVNLLERPTSGSVKVAGYELTQLSGKSLRHARKDMGMIFQHFNLLSSRSVFDNIALPLYLNKTPKKIIHERVLSLLELTGLTDKEKRFPAQLSGGQKQRVAIARALANQPKVLLCDEATSALDIHTTQSILALLKDINQKLNLTILLITHEMDVVKQICDRVAVLDHGRIIETSSVVDLFARPKTEMAQYFVRSALKCELPAPIKEKLFLTAQLHAQPVWRIYFRGNTATEPVIANLSKKLGLELNILQASMEYIVHDTIGIMICSVMDKNNQAQAGIDYLQQQGLEVDIIGYLNTSDI